jgi:peptide/nickel transport system permease protein
MLRFLGAKLAYSLLLLLGITLATFVLIRASGDPLDALLPPDALPEVRASIARETGLDQPLPVQFGQYVWRAVRGDFGKSLRTPTPAMQLVLERFPATLQLLVPTLALALTVGTALGTLAAVHPRSLAGTIADSAAVLGQILPDFWFGLLLIMLFAVQLRWVPASGGGDARSLVLPMVTLAAYPAAMITRLARSSVRDVLMQDYIRTARSKGLRPNVIVRRHVLINAAIPVLAYVGVQAARLVGGSIVVETVFAYPGIGLLAVQAIGSRDVPVIQAFVLLVATLVVAINLTVDVATERLNPLARRS